MIVIYSPKPLAEFAPDQKVVLEGNPTIAAITPTGSKDLFREDDFQAAAAASPTNASYAVLSGSATREGKAINLTIKLRHVN